MRKKILWTLPVIVLAILLGGAIKSYAGTSEHAVGWLWGGSDSPASLGWVSMNNIDESGAPVNGATSYGVDIPLADGSVTGYAWSENYGWISFNAADISGCPVGACSANRVGNTLTGWARILSIKNGGANSGGWSGWVSLDSNTAGSATAYGVSIDPAALDGTGPLVGYAWSDELGWIDFSRASVVAPKILKVCPQNPTVPQGASQQMRAYYDSAQDCSSVTDDVTVSTAWSETSDPNGAITISAAGLVDAAATGSTIDAFATIEASYNPGFGAITQSTTVAVPGICIPDTTCGGADFSVVCKETVVCNSCNIDYFGTKSCRVGDWIEVAP